MARVLFQFEDGGDVSIFAVPGENLLEVARKANVAIDAPCSGNGSCGKCQVRLVSGTLKSEKTRHITQEQYDNGWRLACASTVEDDVCVLVPDIAAAYKGRLKTADLSSPRSSSSSSSSRRASTARGSPAQLYQNGRADS